MDNQDFSLSFQEKGKGKTIVLLHGFLESHKMWEPLRLDTHFRIIAIDLPGHGQSKHAPTIENMKQIALVVLRTLEENDILEFDLIGHSLGGYVALELFESMKQKGKLILLNSNYWQDDEKKQADRLRVANLALKNKKLFIREAIPGLFSRPEKHQLAIETLIQEAFEIPAEHIASSAIAMRNRQDKLKIMLENSEKISILQGETDKLCPLERIEIDVAWSGIPITIIPNAGHMSHLENTKRVRTELLKILSFGN